jgi:hypothetical protein
MSSHWIPDARSSSWPLPKFAAVTAIPKMSPASAVSTMPELFWCQKSSPEEFSPVD